MTILAALKAEIATLENELLGNVVYQRLLAAKQMAALYEAPPAPRRPPPAPYIPPSPLTAPVQVQPQPRPVDTPPRRGNPERAKALDAARLFLQNRINEPTPTSVIYDHIVSLGIEIGGNDPKNNLSAMLSNASALFKSHGRTGWTLAAATPNVFSVADDTDEAPVMRSERELEARGYDAPPAPPQQRLVDDLE